MYANAINYVNRIVWKEIHQKSVPNFFSFLLSTKYFVIFNFTLLIICKSKKNKCAIDFNFNFQNICLQKVSIHVHPAFTPPYLFPIGDVAITYTATDLSSNQASCTFHIKVIGKSSNYLGWFMKVIQCSKGFVSPFFNSSSHWFFLLALKTTQAPPLKLTYSLTIIVSL